MTDFYSSHRHQQLMQLVTVKKIFVYNIQRYALLYSRLDSCHNRSSSEEPSPVRRAWTGHTDGLDKVATRLILPCREWNGGRPARSSVSISELSLLREYRACM